MIDGIDGGPSTWVTWVHFPMHSESSGSLTSGWSLGDQPLAKVPEDSGCETSEPNCNRTTVQPNQDLFSLRCFLFSSRVKPNRICFWAVSVCVLCYQSCVRIKQSRRHAWMLHCFHGPIAFLFWLAINLHTCSWRFTSLFASLCSRDFTSISLKTWFIVICD